MANTRPTRRLIERKVIEVEKEVAKQQIVVNRLEDKKDSTEVNYNSALAKLNSMKSELSDYKKDKV